MTMEVGGAYSDPGATALDDVDGIINVVITGTVDVSVVGDYEITYTATDLSNNTSNSVRTINVIDTTPEPDTTPPEINLIGDEILNITVGSMFTDPGATAIDDVDGEISPVITGSVDTSVSGIYTLTYTATDIALNESTTTRIVVVDTGTKLNQPKSVFVSGNYAYVVSESSNSLEIIDISSPENPKHRSSISHGANGLALSSPKSVFVSDDYAYVVSYSNNLNIFDVSDPISPTLVGTISNGDGNAGLDKPIYVLVVDDYAYVVSFGGHNVEIIDVSSPSSPSHISSVPFGLPITTTALAVVGDYLYATFWNIGNVGGGLKIFNVSDPFSPVFSGNLEHNTDGSSIDNPQSVFVDDDYAYITSRGANTFEIVDVSNADAPFHVGNISHGSGDAALLAPINAFVDNNYAYVVSFVGDTLEVLDISDPSSPTHVSTLTDGQDGAELSR
ncbi:DUF5011 domain-containing protein [Candidatus Nomurabacteria bacterium]|nr:DUF5011 domain-containing protein [Candidatus Nomurabacteria bacterium]